MSTAKGYPVLLGLLFQNLRCSDAGCTGGPHLVKVTLYLCEKGSVHAAIVEPRVPDIITLMASKDSITLPLDRESIDRVAPLACLIREELSSSRIRDVEAIDTCLRTVIDAHNAHLELMS